MFANLHRSIFCRLSIYSLSVAFVLASHHTAAGAPADPEARLPRFTEVREAAALFFVNKQLPELLPLLEELKKSNEPQYRREIREIFQATEWLADLQEDPRRHDLEVKIWKAENKAFTLVAQLSTPNEGDRNKRKDEIMDLARELVDLDIQVLELKAEQLDKELGEVKDELAKTRDNSEKQARERFEQLLERATKLKKKGD
jgi:hypothetical protein